jgi:hypothetical protein
LYHNLGLDKHQIKPFNYKDLFEMSKPWYNFSRRVVVTLAKQCVVSEIPCEQCGAEMVLFAKKVANGEIINWWSCVEFGMQYQHVAVYEKVGA